MMFTNEARKITLIRRGRDRLKEDINGWRSFSKSIDGLKLVLRRTGWGRYWRGPNSFDDYWGHPSHQIYDALEDFQKTCGHLAAEAQRALYFLVLDGMKARIGNSVAAQPICDLVRSLV